MLIPMLTPQEVQAAILILMKSQAELVSAVQDEIREDNWMGTTFKYPAYRLAVNTLSPQTNGECRPLIMEVAWAVYCFSESTSSQQSSYLAGLVAAAMMGKQIRTTTIVPVTRINIPDNGIMLPVPEGERFWRAEVNFRAQIKRSGMP